MAKTTDTEMRVLNPEDVELRIEDGETPKITGYAAKFGKWSADLGGFREKIKKGFFDDVLEDDVRGLKNHDSNFLLGRSPKTMKLSVNSVGLRFEIETPNTSVGRDTVEEIRRGDISGCSFAFSVAEDDWKYLEDGSVERTLIKASGLFDVGPVVYPAYPDTSVAARSLEKLKAENKDPGDETADGIVVEEEQLESDQAEPTTIGAERQRQIRRGYRRAGRVLNRCRPKTD